MLCDTATHVTFKSVETADWVTDLKGTSENLQAQIFILDQDLIKHFQLEIAPEMREIPDKGCIY